MSRTVVFKYESASVDLIVWEDGQDEATVSRLYSRVRNQGHATEVMKKLISYADENRLVLLLEVGRFGHPVGPDNTYLVGFYERFGFVKDSKSANKRVLMYRSQVLHGL